MVQVSTYTLLVPVPHLVPVIFNGAQHVWQTDWHLRSILWYFNFCQ